MGDSAGLRSMARLKSLIAPSKSPLTILRMAPLTRLFRAASWAADMEGGGRVAGGCGAGGWGVGCGGVAVQAARRAASATAARFMGSPRGEGVGRDATRF